jgi:hypothetical protein
VLISTTRLIHPIGAKKATCRDYRRNPAYRGVFLILDFVYGLFVKGFGSPYYFQYFIGNRSLPGFVVG